MKDLVRAPSLRESPVLSAKPVSALRRIVAGCGSPPGYGPHPGTPFLIAMVVFGAWSGLQRGLLAGAIGAAVMLVVFGSMYLIGAHSRGRDSEAARGHR